MKRRRILVVVATTLVLAYAGFGITGCLINSPLIFYGRVVDALGRPAAGVEVSVEISKRRVGLPIPALWTSDPMTREARTVVTDANGMFTINTRGHSLDIVQMSRNGRLPTYVGRNFLYEGPPSLPPFVANPQQPETFKLRPESED